VTTRRLTSRHGESGGGALHRVVRASAGTGKTYALTSRYLDLLRRGAQPASILATTFTRKAAGEILARVLTRLARSAQGAQSPQASSDEDGQLPLPLHGDLDLLVRLCRSLHRLAISTLDSFFFQMVGVFRYELGLSSVMTLLPPEDAAVEELRHEAVEAVLEELTTGGVDDVLARMDRLSRGGARRPVVQALEQLVASLYDLFRRVPERERWCRLEVPASLDAEGLVEAVTALERLRERTPHRALRRAMLSDLEHARQGRWDRFLTRGLAAKLWRDPAEHMYRRRRIPSHFLPLYRPLLDHAVAARLGDLARQTATTWELLNLFDRHYTRLRRQHRLLLFSDLELKLIRDLPALGEDWMIEAYYRLDTRVGHLLLDEFQDTSLEQWRVLEPFAAEIRAHADGSRTFFCVGDPKQAIYGWRGGCAELFDQIEHDLALEEAPAATLNTSYRSSPVVLEAVNRTFGTLHQNRALEEAPAAALEESRGLADAVASWQHAFEPHTAHHRQRPGYVELCTSPEVPGCHERFVADAIARRVAEAPDRSCGVLVQTNRAVRVILDGLGRLAVEASGEGGNPIDDDPAVAVVLSALVLADRPGDEVAAVHVTTSPLGPLLDLRSHAPGPRIRCARQLRRRLAREGLRSLLADWARALAPSCDAHSARRLAQLIALADRYTASGGLPRVDFGAFVRSTPIEDAHPGRLRVMTIHKAKGLEFDMVILPELDRKLVRLGDLMVFVERPAATAPVRGVYRAVPKAVARLDAGLWEAREQERQRRLHDDLSALYVAMTRARFALHMIDRPLKVRQDGQPSRELTFGTLLRGALCPDATPGDLVAGERVLYRDGDPHWWQTVEGRPAPVSEVVKPPSGPSAASPGPSAAPPAPSVGPGLARSGSRPLRLVRPSALEPSGGSMVRNLLRLDRASDRLRGTLLHAWIRQIDWLTPPGGGPSLDGLRAEASRIAPGTSVAWVEQCLEAFLHMLAQPTMREALARPVLEADEEVELWRERRFAVIVGEQLLHGAFDRVSLVRQRRRPVRAELLDFKTETVVSSWAATAERHRPQLAAYRTALGHLVGLDPAQIRARLLVAGEERVESFEL
jgi:ATP-dependent helicase/nuclease subunit A